MRQINRKSQVLSVLLFLFWFCKRFLAQYSVLLIEKRSNQLFQRGLELTTKRSRGSIRRQFFLLWNYDEKKRCTKGRHAPSCISFHLNAARMRCAPIQFARVLGCRLCCGFGRRTSNSGRLPGSGGKVMQERSEKRFLHHFSSRPLGRLE